MQNGVLLALLSYAVYAWGDGLIKLLGESGLSVFQVGLFNTIFAALFLFVFKPQGESWAGFWRGDRPFAVHARSIIAALCGPLVIYAFTTIPFAEVYAILFLAPIFVTLLSVVVLGEEVGPWRWAAVVLGFCGILLVVKPGFRAVELGHLTALCVSFLGAVSLIMMRSLAKEKQTTILGVLVFYALVVNLIGVAFSTFATPGMTMPDWTAFGVLFLVGACTAGGHRLLLLAARLSPANVIAPTHYSQMLWAVVIGAAFFAEYPDWISIFGLAVVAASGLLTLVRERVRLGTVRWNPFGRNRL